ncbi:hypothetical protein GCM10010517_44330 [Streptosporangium fragile]|uniref:Uncharacterized protein n=1 Tax=Streptosporangium fragile TaxID=46186 RepID=A0ABN3W1A8_9ACTN
MTVDDRGAQDYGYPCRRLRKSTPQSRQTLQNDGTAWRRHAHDLVRHHRVYLVARVLATPLNAPADAYACGLSVLPALR